MNEISNAAIAAVRLLARENPDHLEYQEAAAQFKKAAEVCRLRAKALENLQELPSSQ